MYSLPPNHAFYLHKMQPVKFLANKFKPHIKKIIFTHKNYTFSKKTYDSNLL